MHFERPKKRTAEYHDFSFRPTKRLGSAPSTRRSQRNPRSCKNEGAYADVDSEDEDALMTRSRLRHTWRSAGKSGDERLLDELIKQDSKAAILLKSFPVEVHQIIADFLPNDKSVCNYSLICQSASRAISSSFWRKRFLEIFDRVEGLDCTQIATSYRYRQDILRKWICFDLRKWGGAISTSEKRIQAKLQDHCLEVFQSLILESDAEKVSGENGEIFMTGKNMGLILDLVGGKNSTSHLDILDAVFKTELDKEMKNYGEFTKIVSANWPGSSLYLVQLCLTSIILHPDHSSSQISYFDISQYLSYEMESRQPVFLGAQKQEINVRWLLHVVNFFKFHLKSAGEGLLAHNYVELERDQYPQLWAGKIQPGVQCLKPHWKGAYLYMEIDTLTSLRMWKGNSNYTVYPDSLDTNEAFQDITLFFGDAQYEKEIWPAKWDTILFSEPLAENEEKLKRRYLWGSCTGSKSGHFFGCLTAVETQQAIYGFQRLTLIKFYTKIDHNNEQVYDPDQVWGYEGCVLPGATIIIGRWFDITTPPDSITRNSGPFIWWNVDRSTAISPINEQDAFKFLDKIQDPDFGLY